MSAQGLPEAKVANTTLTIPIYTDLSNATKHWTDGEFTIGDITAVGDIGLGLLNVALDPLHALIGSAVGSLMDLLVNNITWLKDSLNLLLGNPDAIFEHAQKWQTISTNLAAAGNAHADTANQLPTWEGPASDAYTQVLKQVNENFKAGTRAAAKMADWVTIVGTGVAMFRDIIWQMVKDFVTEVVEAAILAAASAIPSVGASIAAFTGWFGTKMAVMGARVTSKLAKLMRWASKVAKKLGMSGKAFEKAAKALSKYSQKLSRLARTRIQAGRTQLPTRGRHAAPERIKMKPEMPGKTKTKEAFGENGADVYDKIKKVNSRVVKPVDKGQTKGTTEFGGDPEVKDIER